MASNQDVRAAQVVGLVFLVLSFSIRMHGLQLAQAAIGQRVIDVVSAFENALVFGIVRHFFSEAFIKKIPGIG